MRLELLKRLELLLSAIFLPGVHIILAEPVMSIRQIGIQFDCLRQFRK